MNLLQQNSRVYNLVYALDQEVRYRLALDQRVTTDVDDTKQVRGYAQSKGTMTLKIDYRMKGLNQIERKVTARFFTAEGKEIPPRKEDHVTAVSPNVTMTSV